MSGIILYFLAAIGLCVVFVMATAVLYLAAVLVKAAWPAEKMYTGWHRPKR